jgi:hypothetical protein
MALRVISNVYGHERLHRLPGRQPDSGVADRDHGAVAVRGVPAGDQVMKGDHRSNWHRFKWWFLRRTPEYRRCERAALAWQQVGVNMTPGMIWTLRNAKRRELRSHR